MLQSSLIVAVVVVCAYGQHAAIPAAPTYPPGHPGRAAHDAAFQQPNNPHYNPHHAEYFRNNGQAYNPGQPIQQAQPAQNVHPTHAPLPTYAPGHPAHQLHAQLLMASGNNPSNNPNYNPHHAAYFQSIGKPYNPPAPQQQQYQAPQQQYQAPRQQYQAPQQQYQPPQQQYQAPQQQYNAPQQNRPAVVSNHINLSYDIGVGKPSNNGYSGNNGK